MLVKQYVPDGDFCGKYSADGTRADMCIFLDKSCYRSGDAFVCRRHRDVTLGTEDSLPVNEKQCIHDGVNIVKCRACMKESGGKPCT